MSKDAALLDELFKLSRGDLEQAVFPFPQLESILSQNHFIRLKSYL